MRSLLVGTFLLLFNASWGQVPIEGSWLTGFSNTVIEILELDGQLSGQIKSSNDPKIEVGTVVIKELEQVGEKWAGKLFIGKTDEPYDIELKPEGHVLGVLVHVGYKQEQARWPRAKQ